MMTRRGFAGGLLLGTAVFGLGGCSKIEPSETLRYRLTVEVETPEGVKSAHSVWEYKITDYAVGFTEFGTSHRGEAVALDLPGDKTLFALLVSGDSQAEYPAYVIFRQLQTTPEYKEDYKTAFLEVFPRWRSAKESWVVPKTLPAQNQKATPPSGYPMLVTFKDIADPTSVMRVDPHDLAASFGAGYRLTAITVQVTDEPVTVGIGKRLGWLDNLNKYRTDPSNPFTNTLPSEIGGLRMGTTK